MNTSSQPNLFPSVLVGKINGHKKARKMHKKNFFSTTAEWFGKPLLCRFMFDHVKVMLCVIWDWMGTKTWFSRNKVEFNSFFDIIIRKKHDLMPNFCYDYVLLMHLKSLLIFWNLNAVLLCITSEFWFDGSNLSVNKSDKLRGSFFIFIFFIFFLKRTLWLYWKQKKCQRK